MCYVCTNCGRCGKASDVHTLVKCPNCDKFVIPGSSACIHCGTSLTAASVKSVDVFAMGSAPAEGKTALREKNDE